MQHIDIIIYYLIKFNVRIDDMTSRRVVEVSLVKARVMLSMLFYINCMNVI